jgi:3-dehydroquinate synthetase
VRRVTVAVDPPYDIDVGVGVLDRLEVHRSRYRRLAVVTQHGIRAALGPLLDAVVGDSLVIEIGDGEGAKTMASVEALCRELAQQGILRGDVVVALGGGVVGDTAGFAAAIYHRGIDVRHRPRCSRRSTRRSVGRRR